MTLTLEEERLLESIDSVQRSTSTKMGYYTLIHRLNNAGFSMPKRYMELFDTHPSLLVSYNEESGMVEGMTEDEVKVLEAPVLTDFKELAHAQYPNHVLERIGKIFDGGSKNGNGETFEVFDSRFKINGYRLDMMEHVVGVRLFFNYKKGKLDAKKKAPIAFQLTNMFFRAIHESRGKRRGNRKNVSIENEAYGHFNLHSVPPKSGYTKEGVAFVDLPVFEEALPVYRSRELGDYATYRVYGENLNEAYINAADYIVQNYDSNGDLKND